MVAHVGRRSIGTQTIYRESEVQTDPYSPEVVLKPGSKPEVLSLAALNYGNGLPAGVHEVEMILRQRHRNEVEASLPKLKDIFNDPVKIAERRRVLDELDAADWAYREKEIDESVTFFQINSCRIQEQRMKILKSLLQKREKNIHMLDSRRLNNLWDIKRCENAKFVEKVRHLLLRKTFLKMTESQGKNIICNYADFSSEVYAPLTRNGQFLDKNAKKFKIKSPYLETMSGLMELEEFMVQRNFLEQEIKCPQPKSKYTAAGHKKAAYRYELEMIELEKLDALVAELQNVIRGRADQIRYYRDKEKRIDLIKELRSTHTLLDDDALVLDTKLNVVRMAQAQHNEILDKFDILDQELTRYEGPVTGDMLDLLSKEMVRLLEEERVRNLANKAKLERRMREAKESGRRQIEERRRREHEEMFKQMVKVYQDTTDRYLEDLFKYTIETTASVMAEDELERIAEEMQAKDIEASLETSELRANEVASEVIRNFLIPHVDRLTQKYLTSLKEKPLLLAAHKEVIASARAMASDHHSASAGTASCASSTSFQTQTDAFSE
ncbi:Cilia- and flagella-associated protein 91 [Cichlidogyrus casuarinus]|uniref:Cilia- and flagella-associated protein 91 n=1 Tax=Cichlidogyrus casuarinus TaxID=1844966 RepID=A0ABD2Q812_9PLAT